MSTDWIDYGKTWKEFWKEGLNKPGTLIDAESYTELIGDINTKGGGCDCCGTSDKTIVKRYKVVWVSDVT